MQIRVAGKVSCFLSLYLSALGSPFKWSKQRGGLKVEWIGLLTDYSCFKIGVSPSLPGWLVGRTRLAEVQKGP